MFLSSTDINNLRAIYCRKCTANVLFSLIDLLTVPGAEINGKCRGAENTGRWDLRVKYILVACSYRTKRESDDYPIIGYGII